MLIIKDAIIVVATTSSISSNSLQNHQSSCKTDENQNHKGQQTNKILTRWQDKTDKSQNYIDQKILL